VSIIGHYCVTYSNCIYREHLHRDLDSGQILLACVFGNIPFETNNFDLGGFPVLHSFRATGSYFAETQTQDNCLELWLFTSTVFCICLLVDVFYRHLYGVIFKAVINNKHM